MPIHRVKRGLTDESVATTYRRGRLGGVESGVFVENGARRPYGLNSEQQTERVVANSALAAQLNEALTHVGPRLRSRIRIIHVEEVLRQLAETAETAWYGRLLEEKYVPSSPATMPASCRPPKGNTRPTAGPGVARGAALLRLLRSNVSSDPRSHCGFYPMRASLVAISDAQAYKE